MHQRAEEVQEAQRTLGEAQLALSRAHDALSHNAERALAYARVFCQHEPERLEQIAAIQRQGLKLEALPLYGGDLLETLWLVLAKHPCISQCTLGVVTERIVRPGQSKLGLS